MKKVVKSLYNAPDFKDENGFWVKSYNLTCENFYTQYHTRSGRLWHKMNDRCREGGNVQKEKVTYVGCKNEFTGYQEFTDWCQTKFGYSMKDTSGKYWALDKDLKVWGNKVYSDETCIFVPNRINSLINMPKHKTKNSSIPIGVAFSSDKKKYETLCKEYGTGKTLHLGVFRDKTQAHREWQLCKAKQFITASSDPEINQEISDILIMHAERILEDYNLNRETVKL